MEKTMGITPSRSTSEVARYALFGVLFGALFPIVATVVQLANFGLAFTITNIIGLQTTDRLLWIINTAPLFLGLFAAFAGYRQDRLIELNKRVNLQNIELGNSKSNLEQRVKDRTRSLEQYATRIEFVAGTARQLAIVQDLSSLFSNIFQLIDAQFDSLLATVYLVDDNQQYAIPTATSASGERFDILMSARLPLEMTNIIGASVLQDDLRLVRNTERDSPHSTKIRLSGTNTELAIPLRVRERAIGVLYLQSEHTDAFSAEDVDVLNIVAAQVAIGVNNARLYNEAKSALADSRETIEKFVRQEWTSFKKQARQTGYVYDGKQITPLNGRTRLDRAKTITQTGSLSLDKVSANVTVPIKLRGLTIGVLEVRPKKGTREWTEDELSLLEAAADRAAFALENARLVDGAQRRASRERAIGEISNRIGAISDRNLIMQTAVEELGRRIGNTEVIIELDPNFNPETPQKA